MAMSTAFIMHSFVSVCGDAELMWGGHMVTKITQIHQRHPQVSLDENVVAHTAQFVLSTEAFESSHWSGSLSGELILHVAPP